MKLHGEPESSNCSARLSVPVSQGRPSLRGLPPGRRRVVGRSAWRFPAILVVCLLLAGCSTFRRPEPSTSRWWKGSGPNPTASRKQDKTNDKSWFGSWFASREREKPKTVNDWLGQTSPVHP
jgi:hypothetical protein